MKKVNRTIHDLTDKQLECRRGHLWGEESHSEILYTELGAVYQYTATQVCIRCNKVRKEDVAVPSFERIGDRWKYSNDDPTYHLNEHVTRIEIRREQFRRWSEKRQQR